MTCVSRVSKTRGSSICARLAWQTSLDELPTVEELHAADRGAADGSAVGDVQVVQVSVLPFIVPLPEPDPEIPMQVAE